VEVQRAAPDARLAFEDLVDQAGGDWPPLKRLAATARPEQRLGHPQHAAQQGAARRAIWAPWTRCAALSTPAGENAARLPGRSGPAYPD
jgi:hypothetical protein